MLTITEYTLPEILPEALIDDLRAHPSIRLLEIDMDKQIRYYTVWELTEMALTVMRHTECKVVDGLPFSVICLNKIHQLAVEKYNKEKEEYAQRYKIS